ncbi:MAG: hypothetical protein EPO58_01290 [Chitinophagaceae bacterium]|nr:MAG: hypothetical protein EPO58_01290 [Chitinophagaceae bacterium]
MYDPETIEVGHYLKTPEGYWEVTDVVPDPKNPQLIGTSAIPIKHKSIYGPGPVPLEEIEILGNVLEDFGFDHVGPNQYEITTANNNTINITRHNAADIRVDVNGSIDTLVGNSIHTLQKYLLENYQEELTITI